MKRYNEDIEINLKDLIAALIAKILPIAVCTILIGALSLGYAVIKGNNVEAEIPTEEEIVEAREILSSTDADIVDRIYAQYVSYTQYKESLQKYFDNFLFTEEDNESYIQMTSIFHMSSNVYGANSIFTSLALTPEIYDQISEILPDEETVSDIYQRVWISSGERNGLALLNEDEDGVFVPNEFTITVNVIAKSKEQCQEIEDIIDKALDAQLATLRTFDPNATLSFIGSNCSENLRSWVTARQNDAISQLNSVENTIKNFNNNQVNNLSAEQKAYYNLLIARDADQPLRIQGPSKKKFLVIGAFGGFVLACGYVVLKYLFTTSIRTKEDISLAYNIPVLNTITIDGKKHPLFDKLIRRLRNIDGRSMGASIEMVASDIGILMDKSGTDSLYLIETSGSDDESSIAAKLVDKIKSENNNYDICVGKPLDSAEELKKMASADNVVLLAEIQKTKMDLTDKYYELFQRYGSNVLGSIVSVRP